MQDRAQQALAKQALEPEWEARFEPNSYGFRPGRSCQDAIDAIFLSIRYKPKFVLDADIKGCFDNINQEVLIAKLQTYTAMRQVIKGWLKAGALEGVDFTPTERGTPQGGVISPLLANIALHGMEETCNGIKKWTSRNAEKAQLVRYADDFVILHSDKATLDKATEAVTSWLKDMGLYLSPSKTRVTHTLTPYEENVGFDFLGFTVRQFQVGKTHTGKDTHGKPLGFKTTIKPSKEKVKSHMREMKREMRKLRNGPQSAVIRKLNPMTRGWSNYYRAVVAKTTFSRCDKTLFFQLLSWSKFRHPTKGKHWIYRKYWHRIENHDAFAAPLKNPKEINTSRNSGCTGRRQSSDTSRYAAKPASTTEI